MNPWYHWILLTLLRFCHTLYQWYCAFLNWSDKEETHSPWPRANACSMKWSATAWRMQMLKMLDWSWRSLNLEMLHKRETKILKKERTKCNFLQKVSIETSIWQVPSYRSREEGRLPLVHWGSRRNPGLNGEFHTCWKAKVRILFMKYTNINLVSEALIYRDRKSLDRFAMWFQGKSVKNYPGHCEPAKAEHKCITDT